MIVSTIIIIIALLAAIQNDKRRLTALVFAGLTLVHEVFFQGLGGFYYFFTAALIDATIIALIVKLRYTTKLTENLIFISLGFIALNGIGWLMWEFSLFPQLYVFGAIILYLCAIVCLLNWDGVEDGNYKIDRWNNYLRVFNYSGYNNIS